MQPLVIEIVETLCRESGQNDIYSVGVIAALRAVNDYRSSHPAKDNPNEIVCSDIKYLGDLLLQMHVKVLQRLEQGKQPADTAPANAAPRRYAADVVRSGYRSCTFYVTTSSREEVERLALEQAGDHDYSVETEYASDYEVSSVREVPADTDAVEIAYADLLTPAIQAEVHSDDHIFEVDFDAAPWFAQATAADIIALHAIEWRGNYAADAVAEFFENSNHDITALLNYCRATQDSRHSTGFECSVNEDDAMAWLKQHRPDLWARLLREHKE